MAECQNTMHIFEILMIIPFTNAIVEHLFSRMNRVKTDFRNKLSRSRLDMCLRVGEEGPSIKYFKPDHVMDCWCTEKKDVSSHVHIIILQKSVFVWIPQYAELSTLTMSDLENSDDEECFSL